MVKDFMNCEGLLIWRAACTLCKDEFEVDSLLNPFPTGLDCPTCRKLKQAPERIHFTTDTLPRTEDTADDLEAPIDEPT